MKRLTTIEAYTSYISADFENKKLNVILKALRDHGILTERVKDLPHERIKIVTYHDIEDFHLDDVCIIRFYAPSITRTFDIVEGGKISISQSYQYLYKKENGDKP